MITTIKLTEPKAKEIVETLAKEYSWRFIPALDCGASLIYNYFDEAGFEYTRYIFLRPSKDNKKIIVYVNKKDFSYFIRDFSSFYYVEEDIISLIKDYIEDVEPHIIDKD